MLSRPPGIRIVNGRPVCWTAFLFLGFLLATSPIFGADGETTLLVRLPSTGAIEIDGTIEADEWSGAERRELAHGGEVLVSRDAQHAYFALRGHEPGWCHLYLKIGDTVHVLHASAALGTATYERQGDAWHRSRAFEWGVRGGGQTSEEKAARQEHFQQDGWLANTQGRGSEAEFEFVVDFERFPPSQVSWAVVYAADAESPHFWPSGLDDDTLAPELIFGKAPDHLNFDPGSWARLIDQE